MNELDLFVKAVEGTNEVFISRGRKSGLVSVCQYLNSGNLMYFTGDKGIRKSMENVDHNKLSLMVKSKLIEVAKEICEKDGIDTDNAIINAIIGFAFNYNGDDVFQDSDYIKAFIDKVIVAVIDSSLKTDNGESQDKPIGSDILMNALQGRVRVMGKSSNMEKTYHNLLNFYNSIDPDLEERIIFYGRSGR